MFVTQVVRPFRGVSAVDRRADRRAQLISAGLEVLGANGASGFTMTAVCRQAGLTERYFYESFGNRDELLVAVYDSVVAGIFDKISRTLATAPADMFGRAHLVAGAIIGMLLDDPRIARVYLAGNGLDVLRPRRMRAVQALAAILGEQITQVYGLGRSTHSARVEAASLVIVGGIADLVDHFLDGSLTLGRDELVEECAFMVVAIAEQLAARASAAVSSGPTRRS